MSGGHWNTAHDLDEDDLRLSSERAIELVNECIQLYMWDRLGCDN